MLKGQFDQVVKVIIMAGVMTTILLVLSIGFASTSAVRKTAQEKLDAIDITHILKGCLEKDGLIRQERLDAVFSHVDDECGIADFSAEVRDMESSLTWSFGKRNGVEHRLSFPLRLQTGKIHIGEIRVAV